MRVHPFASLFTAALMAFLPVHAMAQTIETESVSVRDRARPEYDALGRRLGGFDLNASLDLSVASTDNLFAEETDEQDDIIFRVSPYARLGSHWSRHGLSVEAGATFKSHQDWSSEDAETGFVRGTGRLDIGSYTNLSASAGFAHEVESRTDPDSPATPEPVEYDRSNVALTLQHTFNRFRVTGTASQTDFDFEDLQNVRDNEITALRGRLEAEVTPRLGLLLEATTDERDYDNSPALSSEGQTYLVGATINFTDLMLGEVAVGQFEREYDSGATIDGLAVSGNLEWYITRLTTLNFHANRNSEDVIGGNSLQPFTATEYGARVDHELLRNMILTAGVRSGNHEYEGIDREDDYIVFDVGADYLVNRNVALRARYSRAETESEGLNAYRDFEVNTVTFGVTLRL